MNRPMSRSRTAAASGLDHRRRDATCLRCLALAMTMSIIVAPAGAAFAGAQIAWARDTIESGLTSSYARSSLVIDRLGTPHVAYFDYGDSSINYAVKLGDEWLIEVLEDGTGVDFGTNLTALPSLALDAQARPHVVYVALRDTVQTVVHAVRAPEGWTRETVDAPAGVVMDARLALGADDTPNAVYTSYDGSQFTLFFAVRADGQWAAETLGQGSHAALVMGADGVPHVLFLSWEGTLPGNLLYAESVPGGGWIFEDLGVQGSWPDFVLDDGGKPCLSFKSGSLVRYGERQDGVWTFISLGSTYTDARHAPIGLDWRGRPVVVYCDQIGRYLKWAYRQDDVWHFEQVDPDGIAVTAVTPSLAFDPAGHPRICARVPGALDLLEGRDSEIRPVLQTIVMDGMNDFLLVNRIDAEPYDTELGGPDLRALYVTNDTTHLYVGIEHATDGLAALQLGVAIDTGSIGGGTADPWDRRIDWGASSWQPDFVFYIDLDAAVQDAYRWDGANWVELAPAGPAPFGWAVSADFRELAVPLVDLGVANGGLVQVETWTTLAGADRGPLDCAANDALQLSTRSGTQWEVALPVALTAYHTFMVMVPPDVEPPFVLSADLASLPSAGWCEVTFSEPVFPATATVAANYALSGCDGACPAVSGVVLDNHDPRIVHLWVGGPDDPCPGENPTPYAVTVTGVFDQVGNEIIADGTANVGRFLVKRLLFRGHFGAYLAEHAEPPDGFAVAGDQAPLLPANWTCAARAMTDMGNGDLWESSVLVGVPLSPGERNLRWNFVHNCLNSEPSATERVYTMSEATAIRDTLEFWWGSLAVTGVGDRPIGTGGLALGPIHPNPFNPRTTIAYSLPGTRAVTLRVFDVSGRLVQTLLDGVVIESGRHEVVWDGRDHGGRRVATGVYFAQLLAGDERAIERMMLVK